MKPYALLNSNAFESYIEIGMEFDLQNQPTKPERLAQFDLIGNMFWRWHKVLCFFLICLISLLRVKNLLLIDKLSAECDTSTSFLSWN